MKEKPARTPPPALHSPYGAGLRPVNLRPQPLPSFLCPQRPTGHTRPSPLVGGPGTGPLDPRPPPHPASHLLPLPPPPHSPPLLVVPCFGGLGCMKQSIVRLRRGSPEPPPPSDSLSLPLQVRFTGLSSDHKPELLTFQNTLLPETGGRMPRASQKRVFSFPADLRA